MDVFAKIGSVRGMRDNFSQNAQGQMAFLMIELLVRPVFPIGIP